MKFNARTIQILRNFSTINPSIVFKPGNEIKTISSSKTVMARATIDTSIDQQFAIYDLGKFLGAISMFESPELTLGQSAMVISEGNEKLSYTYAEPSLILVPPEKEVVLPSPEVEFDLPNEALNRVIKALGIIGAPEIAVTGDGDNIYVEALNVKNQSESTYRVQVGKTDKTFRMVFLAENIKVLPEDYRVSISSRGLSHFKANDIEYWIAIEASSKYEG